MTPLQFEAQHADAWQELDAALAPTSRKHRSAPADRARIAALYRAACEHLAIAESRSYPVWLIERLEALTSRGHQRVYRQPDFGIDKLRRLFGVDFPTAVRAYRLQMLIALVAFVGPLLAIGVLSYVDPSLILSLQDAAAVEQYEGMYGDPDGPIGRRNADSDWAMLGFYIRNNIGVAFQCFAGGLFAGLGSLFFLFYNGAYGGAIAGYLTERGMSSTFYSFVATHSAFELTAIVLSGAAGLKIGHALLAPGRRTRRDALVEATRDSAVVLYGVAAMLLVAAGVEAFWSSARWLPPAVKYSVAAACWIAVFAYFTLQGRRAA